MDDIQPGAITAVLEEMSASCIDMANHATDAAIIDQLNTLASHIHSVATNVLGYESNPLT